MSAGAASRSRRSTSTDAVRWKPSATRSLSSTPGSSPRRRKPRCDSTGPPAHSMRPLSPLAGGSSTTASTARTSVGRFTTKPSAPWAPCSQRSTTERTKFGSRSCGMARSRVGAKEEGGGSMGGWSPPLADLSTQHTRGGPTRDLVSGRDRRARMPPGEQGRRRAAASAGAADFPERARVTGGDAVAGARKPTARACQFCRAGFAGRGTAFARSTERHTLASVSDPRHGLGSALMSRPPRRAAAWPGRLIGRVVDPQAAALQVGAVELLLGALGVLGARHGDEREAARLTRVAIGDDRYRLAGARLREQLAQLVLRDPVGEVADEELLGHLGRCLSAPPSGCNAGGDGLVWCPRDGFTASVDPGPAAGVLAPPSCGVALATPRRSSLRSPASAPGSTLSRQATSRTPHWTPRPWR